MPKLAPVLLLGSYCMSAQTYAAGPQVVSFYSAVDDSDQPYALYVPKNFDASRRYPLVISLHGAGSNHRLNLRRVFGKGNLPQESDAEASRYFPRMADVDFIVAAPLARGTMGYQGIAERDIYDVLADVKKRFPIDENRVYLTGLSMGGGGALWLGLTRPDVWAAVAAVCPAPPAGADELAQNALNLPVHLFQGAIDPVVPAQGTRRWHTLFEQLGAPVEYTEYPGVRHNSWDFAYKNAAIFDWFGRFRRNPFPGRVRFVTSSYKYDAAYWVRIDGLTPGTPARIDARFAGENQIVVETANVLGLSLRVEGHPLYAPTRPVSVRIDGQSVKPGKTLWFSRTARGWRASPYAIPPGEKRLGAEGPAAEAVASRHTYVYGTAGGPSPEELIERRAIALEAAEWSSPRNRLLASFRTVPDKEASEGDLQSASLILFGTKASNDLIARFADRLPLALNPSAADYGLIFVYPAGRNYILIDSGKPWWEGAEEAGLGGRPFGPLPYRVLLALGDYVLFRGSLEHIVAAGRFTNDWKLSAADAKKLLATGAVEVK